MVQAAVQDVCRKRAAAAEPELAKEIRLHRKRSKVAWVIMFDMALTWGQRKHNFGVLSFPQNANNMRTSELDRVKDFIHLFNNDNINNLLHALTRSRASALPHSRTRTHASTHCTHARHAGRQAGMHAQHDAAALGAQSVTRTRTRTGKHWRNARMHKRPTCGPGSMLRGTWCRSAKWSRHAWRPPTPH